MTTPPAAKTDFTFDKKNLEYIRKNMLSWWRFKLITLVKIPMNFLSGMRVEEFTEEHCKVSVPFKWLNQNPFRSTFWAVLGMTAELAAGAMVVMYTHKQKPSISTLVTGSRAKFVKKAVKSTTFVCNDGLMIAEAVRKAVETGEGQLITCRSVGYNPDGEVVAEFEFDWSMKARSK